ncbi:MAG: DUF3987 domain-containing protein [Pyrinomonadaceae bacterium]
MKFTDPNSRPKVDPPRFDNIPAELRRLDQWVNWHFEWNSKEWTKVPVDPQTGRNASSTDRSTWGSFDAAREQSEQGEGVYDGIGFVFSENDPYTGIDFDNCLDGDQLLDTAREWAKRFDSYTEKSVSGTGLHVICKGVVGKGMKVGDFEVYDRARYFTFSGNVGKRKVIADRQNIIDDFKTFLRPEKVQNGSTHSFSALSACGPSVQDRLEKAFQSQNGHKIRALHDGSVNGYKSQSEAEQAYCSLVAFWSSNDPSVVDQMFQSSRLMREKWKRADYRNGTISKALSSCGDFYDFSRNGNGYTPATSASKKEQKQEDQWEPPATFYEHSRPPFPVGVLPRSIRPFVEGLACETQTPVDLPAMLGLTIAAGALAGKVRVQARLGWSEPTNIYCVCVLPPGNRKSAVFQSVSEPLEEIERNLVAATRDEIAKAASEYRMLEERKVQLEKAGSRADNPEDRRTKSAEAVMVAQQLAAAKVPVAPRLLVSDVTSEVVSTLLAEQGGRITMLSTEGGIFETIAGRYSAGVSNIDVYLKGNSGDPLRVDRRGRSESVQHPALTIGLTVQPDVISGLAKTPGFRGRGLLGRFLYCLPQSTVGNRQIDPQPLSEVHREQFRRTIRSLAEIEASTDRKGDPAPRMLYLTAEANGLLKEFERELEPKLVDDGELGALTDWAGKLAGAVVRLAAILWLINKSENLIPWPEKIDADAMIRAIELGRYLTEHARIAFAEMGADAEVENAKRLLRWIEKSDTRKFTRREAHQAHRSWFKTVDAIDPALDLLESHSYIRSHAENSDKRPGRKASQAYDVNPFLFSNTTHALKS